MGSIRGIFISINFLPRIINCSATKNQRIFPVCFKSDFALTFVLISIVCPQVAVQANDVFRRCFCTVIICRRDISNIDAPAGIDFQIILSFVQLFHDDDVVGILAIGDFNETVVSSFIIRFFCNCRGLAVIIPCTIRIFQSIVFSFSDFLIVSIIIFSILFRRFLWPSCRRIICISSIMTKRNRACFISRGLIADGRAIFDSYICTIPCCQCIISICRATSNTDGKSSIYRALQAANSYRGSSKGTIHRTAENRSCFTMSFIHTATTQGCMGSKGIVIESTEYRGFVAKGIVVVAASYRRILCGRCIGRATDNNSRHSVFISNIVCTTNDNRVLTKGTIRLFYYLSFFRLAFFDATAKNQSVLAFICY